MSKIEYAGLSDRGRYRRHNEDRWLADPALGLYLVADGMGGAAAGEEAAQFVVDALPPLLRRQLRGLRDLADSRAPERLAEALTTLSGQLWQESQKHPYLTGMGAAVVCALVWERRALVGHLGDSRAYLFHQDRLEQLTRDHSAVQGLVDRGVITAAEAARHPESGSLTRFVGMGPNAVPETCSRELRPGDRLLLCSDGLSSMVGDQEMTGILQLNLPPSPTCNLLVDTANLMGGDDNITVVLVGEG